MLLNLRLALLKVASMAPRTLRRNAMPATAKGLLLANTLPRTRDMTMSWMMQRHAATMRLRPILRPIIVERMASKTMKRKPRPTLRHVSTAPAPMPSSGVPPLSPKKVYSIVCWGVSDEDDEEGGVLILAMTFL
jgi:hypothetical protein